VQRQVQAGHGRTTRVPVLYFSQLLAIALGCEDGCLHLSEHVVDPRPRLSKWLGQTSQATALV